MRRERGSGRDKETEGEEKGVKKTWQTKKIQGKREGRGREVAG